MNKKGTIEIKKYLKEINKAVYQFTKEVIKETDAKKLELLQTKINTLSSAKYVLKTE